MRQWLARVMYGRNGPDQLSMCLFIVAMLFQIVSYFVLYPVFSALSWVAMVLAIFRIISKNLYKRREENAKFMGVFGKVRSWFRLQIRKVKEFRTYKYLKCERCHQKLRVPKGRGKIRIKCSNCGHQFDRKV